MKNYKRIVLATDFSQASEVAALRAAKFALNSGAELVLLRVIEHFPEGRNNEWIAPENISPKKFFEEQARNGLDELAIKLKFEKTRKEIIFSNSSARHEIIQFADEIKADLIVLGAHGLTLIGELLTGSTTLGVTLGASCDVLIVRK